MLHLLCKHIPEKQTLGLGLNSHLNVYNPEWEAEVQKPCQLQKSKEKSVDRQWM